VNPVIAAHNLKVVRGGKLILRVDELAVEKGQVLAVVGPNGAGKTCLLHTLALLEPPASGTVRLFDVDAFNGNQLALRRRMALVFQEPLLLDTTVKRNITLPLRMRGISGREANARSDRWLHRFGIGSLSARSARALSGGEAQRTSLARAFAMEPEILLLDEPFTALDYPTRKSLVDELGEVLKEMNLTTVFVTHDYSEIPPLTEQVAVLFDGRIVKRGSSREIFGEDFLKKKSYAPWET